MPLDARTLEAFSDEHGAPFAEALRELQADLGDRGPAEAAGRCISLLAAEADVFGRVRNGDPAPALRILALDGALTEALGDTAAS